jgi:transglutaminase-like putative cysteine protease
MRSLARAASQNSDFVSWALAFNSSAEIESWVRAHFRYRDESEEILRTPDFMLNDALSRLGYLEGDCDDIATFYAATFLVLGIPARFVAIRYTPNNPNFEHVFTQAYDMAEWRTFDATVPPGTDIKALEKMTLEV